MKVLLTVPHSYCPVSSVRICDKRALEAARLLARIMKAQGMYVRFYPNTEILRSNFDLNRKVSRPVPWRQKLDQLISQGVWDLVVDVHSFPNDYVWNSQHPHVDLELLYDTRPGEGKIPNWVIELTHGRAGTVGLDRGIHNDIMDRVTELSPSMKRFLLEVNEDHNSLTNDRLLELFQKLVQRLKTGKKS
jgi:hypothetical protein